MVKFVYDHPRVGTSEIDIEGYAETDIIYHHILRHRAFYENDLLQYLDAIMPPPGGSEAPTLFVDVGANIGNHSIFFGKFLADHVVSVEANPEVLDLLARNLERNIAGRYTILGCAVGSRDGRGKIDLPDGYRNLGGATVHRLIDGQEDSSAVTIRTLDDQVGQVLDRLPGSRIRLIKLDIQGMELEALKGAEALIDQHHPDLVVEASTQSERQQLNAFLQPFGYRAVARLSYTPTYHFIHKPGPGLVARAKLLGMRSLSLRVSEKFKRRLLGAR